MNRKSNSTNIRTTDEIIREKHIVFRDTNADKAMPVEIGVGFEDVDFFCGLEGGELVTIAGWPAMGKTSFALSIVRNVCVGQGLPTLWMTPAIGTLGALHRLVASHCRIALSRVRNGGICEEEQPRFDAGIDEISRSPLFIDDCPGADLGTICNSCREAVERHQVKLAVIDNLQTIRPNHRQNWAYEEEVANAMYCLKRLARELNIPVVIVSQTANKYYKPFPIAVSLPRRSETGIMGAIEEASDKIFFVYRPEEYGIRMDENGRDMMGQAYIMIVKNNASNTTDVRLGFDGSYGRFQELREPLSSF